MNCEKANRTSTFHLSSGQSCGLKPVIVSVIIAAVSVLQQVCPLIYIRISGT